MQEPWTFRELLDTCCDEYCSRWEQAWLEFMRRYKFHIYNCVSRQCANWNVSRIRLQFSDAVNDIVSEVIFSLCKNQFQSLRDFNAKDQESMFFAWLGTVSRRAVGRYVHKHFADRIIDGDFSTMQDDMSGLALNDQWELRESLVATLRSNYGKRGRQSERDILLFQLHAIADFPMPKILELPCFKSVGHRVVDNVTYRIREAMRKRKNETKE